MEEEAVALAVAGVTSTAVAMVSKCSFVLLAPPFSPLGTPFLESFLKLKGRAKDEENRRSNREEEEVRSLKTLAQRNDGERGERGEPGEAPKAGEKRSSCQKTQIS